MNSAEICKGRTDKYTKLGNSDITVSKFCVGCMSFGKASENFHRRILNEDESAEIVKKALDSSINFFDTANGYSFGTSEEYLDMLLRRVHFSVLRVNHF